MNRARGHRVPIHDYSWLIENLKERAMTTSEMLREFKKRGDEIDRNAMLAYLTANTPLYEVSADTFKILTKADLDRYVELQALKAKIRSCKKNGTK